MGFSVNNDTTIRVADQYSTSNVKNAPQNNSSNVASATTQTIPDVNTGTTSTDETPCLTPPKSHATAESLSNTYTGMATSMGQLLAIIQEATSDIVRDNRQATYASQMNSADIVEQQADEMRDAAAVKLAMGVISGAVSIAGGIFGTVTAGKTLKGNCTEAEKLLKGGRLTAQNQFFQAGSKLASDSGEFGSSTIEARIKDMEADAKKIEAMADQVKSINESMMQLVRTAIETYQSIAQSMNETTKRILG